MDPHPLKSARSLARGFLSLSAATLALMVLGALVRAHGAGLACPDWPLCFGRAIPEFDFKVAFEWSHRLLAAMLSLGLAALSFAAMRRPAIRSIILRPLLAAWGLLAVQILLGGLTVLLLLEPWTVMAHLVTGTSFCVALLWISRDLAEAARPRQRFALRPGTLSLAILTAVILGAQLGLGGMVSGYSAGLACPSFPSCDGSSAVPTLSGLVGLQVAHRLNAMLLLMSFVALALRTRRSGFSSRLSSIGLHLIAFQICLGGLNVLMRLPVEVTALHTATAALLALLVAMLLRELVYSRTEEQAPAGAPANALGIG